MSNRSKASSLFDDIFKIQNAAPELEADPEDPEDGFRSGLAEGTEEVEELGPSVLRRKAALVLDDPKYKGKRVSRKTLYSDGEEESSASEDRSQDTGQDEDSDQPDSDEEEDEADEEDEDGSEEADTEEEEDDNEENNEKLDKQEQAAFSLTKPEDDDRDKGKAVAHQLAVWDDLIRCRISMQKLVSFCNQLPQTEIWEKFAENESFNRESRNVHSSIRKLMSAFLDLQANILDKKDIPIRKVSKEPQRSDGMDEEITSSEEEEESLGETLRKTLMKNRPGADSQNDEMEVDEDVGQDEDDDEGDGDEEEEEKGSEESDDEREEAESHKKVQGDKQRNMKRKLTFPDVEASLAKRHMEFQNFRNETLDKWDEKTRLSHGKIKSKNFAAFDMSVLKQIQQVLANKDRLVRRIHQQRTSHRIMGHPEQDVGNDEAEDQTVEDDDDEVEMKQRTRVEMPVNEEIIDDNDFYHICLRDFIEMKQNEETDSATTNKQWLEIQKLRSKQKRKVDTRASKGRKIRYNVKEKLKNYMAPFDKSTWSDEQRDDLFKALFGRNNRQNGRTAIAQPSNTIDIGL